MVEKGVVEEEEPVEGENEVLVKRRRTGSRYCGICRKTGYNVRICLEAEEIDSLGNSK